jgi:hypothetical protein
MKLLSGDSLNLYFDGFIKPISGKQSVSGLRVVLAHPVLPRLDERHVFLGPLKVLIGAEPPSSCMQCGS